MLKRKLSPTKRPSMMKVGSKPSTLSQRNGFSTSRGDASIPKTRFSLNDRSSSSPRLKSFPAEKIKRLEPQPLLNSLESADMHRPMQNNGQGDSLQQPGVQFHPVFQPVPMPNQNISSISEQQVPRTVYPVSNQVNQSELAIPSTMENASMERPAHRPFVPNVTQANLSLRDHSPRKTTSPRLAGPHQTIPQAQMFNSINPEAQVQQRDPWTIENDSLKPLDPEKEPVGGRYAAFHRRNVETHRNESPDIRGQIHPQRSSISDPNVANLSPVVDPTGWQEPQPIYHRYQPNMLHYCNHNGQMEMPRAQITETHPGMTSPQDIAVNQIKNYQRAIQHGSYGWTTHPQSPWIQTQRAQIQPYSIDIVTPGVNVTPDSNMRHQYLQHGMQVPNSNQHMSGNWQAEASQQQQQYYNQGHISSTAPSQPTNIPKQLAVENQQKKEDTKRKPLRFTTPMIRDQEMLVTTMRQQGIAEDIMRRQFDALLAEQRKQLLYLEQLERGDTSGSDKLQQRRRVQRKISRIEEDGKPEWMLHITPPRIPYSTIEKMRYEREVNSQQTTRTNENAVQATGVHDPQQIYDHTTQGNYQQPWQMVGSINWQQQTPHVYVCNNLNVAKQHPGYNMNSAISGDQDQMRYYGYPVQYQPQQQYMQQVQEKWQVQGQEINPRKELQQAQRYEEPEKKLVDSSSLLKLRVYKEVVRKQKQNNGLQDPETVKEAMEALKNPANRKGLEYLESLNKKREKPLSLNGAQDPQEDMTLGNRPQQQYISLNCQQAKMPSANGLENQRNPNNPPPTSNLRQRKLENPHFAEYPRQRANNVSRDCYSLMAERENGTVANSMAEGYQQHNNATMQNQQHNNAAMQNQQHNNAPMHNSTGAFQTHMQSRSENGFQFPGQIQQDVIYKDRKMIAARSPSMPLVFNEQNRPQFYASQMQQYYANRDKNGQVSSVSPQSAMVGLSGFSRGVPVDGNVSNFQQQQQQHYYSPCKNNELQEAITIGGIKYLARKPEYIQNPSAPSLHREQMNPGKYFNPMTSCQ